MDLDQPDDPLADVDSGSGDVGAPIEPWAVLAVVLLVLAVVIVAVRL